VRLHDSAVEAYLVTFRSGPKNRLQESAFIPEQLKHSERGRPKKFAKEKAVDTPNVTAGTLNPHRPKRMISNAQLLEWLQEAELRFSLKRHPSPRIIGEAIDYADMPARKQIRLMKIGRWRKPLSKPRDNCPLVSSASKL